MPHPHVLRARRSPVLAGLLLVALASAGRAQTPPLRAATGGVAGRLVVLPTQGSGLYSWALPVTVGALLKQAQVEALSTETVAGLLQARKLGNLAGGLPTTWSGAAVAAAAAAGQVGKDPGCVLMASWNTAERNPERWTDDTPFWLLATLRQGTTVVFDTTRLPREAGQCYRLADYQTAVRDLADMIAQNLNPGGAERARQADVWRQPITLTQVKCLAEAERDVAAGQWQAARTRLAAAQADTAGAAGALVALRRLVEVNAALARQDPGQAGSIGREAEEAGRALAAEGARTKAWAELSVAEGLRLQGKWPEAGEAYLSWLQSLLDEQLLATDEFFPEAARPELDARKPRLWPHLTSPGLEAQWWATVGLALYRGVSGTLAEPLCTLANQRAAAEPDAATRAAALTVLADQARLRNDPDGALALYQQALALRERLAPGSLDCAALYNRLGNAEADRDDYERAFPWYEKAVSLRERLAPGTLDCAMSYNNLGTVYASQGKLDEALAWYGKALAIRERLTPGSLGCAGTYNNVGAAYRVQGDEARARECFQQALAIYEKEAPGSRDCAVIYNNLGNVECDAGHMDRALERYRQALAIRERLTPDSLPCAMVYNNVAGAYANGGELDSALEWHQKARPILERRAPGSSSCALSYANIGQVYGHKGDFPAALEWLGKALAIYEKLGPRSLDRATTESLVGFYLLNVDRNEEALPHLVRAAQIAPDDASVQVNLAWGRIALKQADEAASALDRLAKQPATIVAEVMTSKDEALAKHLLAQSNPGGYYLLGRVWEAANQIEAAGGAYDQFLESARHDRTWRLLDGQIREKHISDQK